MPCRRHALFVVPALLVLPRPALALRARVGEVTALTGPAAAVFSGEPPRALAPAAPIMMEDLLTTGPAARLACRLEGGLDLRMGENAALRVDALALRGPRPGVALRGFGGALLLDVPRAERPAPVDVAMPWAHIGVRGTRFFAGVLDGVQAVFVVRGRVEVRAPGGAVSLGAGEGVDVAADGSAGGVRSWGPPRIARALALVGAT
jgi:ferric-dicitrate binding protein FerR (iron transport regulator)